MTAKDIVQEYYRSGALHNPEVMATYVHDDFNLEWYSTKGYFEADKNDILALAGELAKSYATSYIHIKKIISEDNIVSVHYTHHVTAIENPQEDMILGHFMVIWEVKDDKLYKAYLMSHQG